MFNAMQENIRRDRKRQNGTDTDRTGRNTKESKWNEKLIIIINKYRIILALLYLSLWLVKAL